MLESQFIAAAASPPAVQKNFVHLVQSRYIHIHLLIIHFYVQRKKEKRKSM